MADIFVPPAAGDSGTQGAQDATLVSGQDPGSLFGIDVSYDSGAGGTPAPGGESQGSADPAGQPNQYPSTEPISGVALGGSGAPGTDGVDVHAAAPGSQAIVVSNPNLAAGQPGGGSGNQMLTVDGAISGPGDWTATAGNYPPAKPVLPGDFSPVPGGPGNNAGRGRVLRGGYLKGQR